MRNFPRDCLSSSFLLFVTTAAGFVNNGDSSRSEIFMRPRAPFLRALRWLALQINRFANNVVRHIVTAVECESQLLDLIKGIYSCFIKKGSDEKV